MAFGGQNVKAAGLDHLFLFIGMLGLDPGTNLFWVSVWIGLDLFHHLHFDVAAKLNIGAATGHVGGDGHSPKTPGIGDDLGFLFVVTRVQYVMRHAIGFQHFRQQFGFLDRGGANQNRLPLGVGVLDGLDDRLELFARGAVNRVMVVNPGDWPVCRYFDHAQLVNLHKLIGFGLGRAGHTRQFIIQTEIVLERHRGEGDVFRLDLRTFFGLNRLMQPVRQAAARHHPASKFVDQHNFVVAHDVILITLEQNMRAQGLGDVMDQRRAFGVVKRCLGVKDTLGMQTLFDEIIAFITIGHGAGFFVQRVVIRGHIRHQLVDLGIKLASVFGGAGNDQRRARFVNQDRVDLIDDGKIMITLEHVLQFRAHVIAQVIKPKFVIGGVGHIGTIGRLLFFIRLAGDDNPGGQAQKAVNLIHPFRIAPRQIIVDGDDMHAAPGQRVQVNRQGCHKGFPLTGFHFRDVALMQENPAHQLHIKRPQPKRAHSSFAGIGEGFGQQIIQGFPLGQTLFEFVGLGPDLFIAQRFEFRL